MGQTLLHLAAIGGNEKILQILLECHAVTDVEDNHGDTPLFLAIRHGQVEIVKILMSAVKQKPKSDRVNFFTNHTTHLDVAIEEGQRYIVDYNNYNGQVCTPYKFLYCQKTLLKILATSLTFHHS